MIKSTWRRSLAAIALSAMALATGCAAPGGGEGAWPGGEQFTYVIPYAPGGSTDPVGREFSRLLGDAVHSTAVVENLPGGDETIGLTRVIQAEPNGLTLGLSSATGVIVQPLVNQNLPFKTVEDYTPIVKMVEAPNVLVVAANSPYKTLDDLIADAKQRPGQIRVGTTGELTNNTFAMVSLEDQAGIDLNIVPFSGGAGEAVLATLGGDIEAAIPTAAGQRSFIDSGELRALAHTGGTAYNEVLPGSVSFSEAGFDVPFSSDYITVAAPGLPDDVRTEIVAKASEVAASDEWAAWCKEAGFVADPLSGADLDEWIKTTTEASKRAIELVEQGRQG
ncbi:Bug family tripartite tricarboxylate transporter substrate binding protein [Mycobacterium neglectum]|uniref:Bug family tripartite tricarboxylate transporter substrate binding protein n=1 Tax=Mycobacterium neglectum TaxID=242737 RepID=UPI000BFF133E|nr:tripartite tricarboxylate transporter substrate binding protein [Mycobacterium neglectum]